MKGHEARLAALEATERDEVDIDALGRLIGLTDAEIAEAKAWTRALPAGTSGWDAARLLGEELGLHPGDIMAEAEQIMRLVETTP